MSDNRVLPIVGGSFTVGGGFAADSRGVGGAVTGSGSLFGATALVGPLELGINPGIAYTRLAGGSAPAREFHSVALELSLAPRQRRFERPWYPSEDLVRMGPLPVLRLGVGVSLSAPPLSVTPRLSAALEVGLVTHRLSNLISVVAGYEWTGGAHVGSLGLRFSFDITPFCSEIGGCR